MALKSVAAGIILAHNYPSSNLRPSEQDLIITKKLIEAGKPLDLQILDHLISTKHNYLSFGDEGLFIALL
ncbi:JAB domain-containing protein [Pedobacter westerhofensis]|uniref:JAB domain-containing protein n=1 Tax=Pedobacter westerhofensis TaxID=425512 RepID=UPI0021CE2EBB